MSATSDEGRGSPQGIASDMAPSQTSSPSPTPAASETERTTSANPPTDEGPKQARKKRWTGVRNCDACRIRKSKCDRLRPCSNCAFRNVKCTYDEAFDSFPMVAVEHNLADVSRLCQNVFALARTLNMPSDELDKLAVLADQLIDQEHPRPREVAGSTASSKKRRSLGEILRTNPQFAALDADLAAKRQATAVSSTSRPASTPRPDLPNPQTHNGRTDAAPPPRRLSSLPHMRQAGPPLVYHPMQHVAPQVFIYGPGAYPAAVSPWAYGYASRGIPATALGLRAVYPQPPGLYAAAPPSSFRTPYPAHPYGHPRPPSAHALSRRASTPSSGRLSPAVLPPLAIPARPVSQNTSSNLSAHAPSTATPSTAVSALTPFRSAHAPTSATTPPSARPPSSSSSSTLPQGGHYVLPPIQSKNPSTDSLSTHLASFATTTPTASAPPSPPIRLAPLRSIAQSEDVEMKDEARRIEPVVSVTDARQDGVWRLPSLSDALYRSASKR
ncbi:C6 transcription factor [Rhodotorula toruloides]|nr:C6 transcription factor [Rhodotorula toruloides]PRQ71890.1 hypothetical protein AAT19DRAFT_10005 [Rhodotorula toruloides]